jgi:chromosome segregation ATPase
MAAKSELQGLLKDRYGINKNISRALTDVECQRLMALLEAEPSALKLVDSFIAKNRDLAINNQLYGKQRNQALARYEQAQAEYLALEASIVEIENSNEGLAARKRELELEAKRKIAEINQTKVELENQKRQLEQESAILEKQVANLKARSQDLEGQVRNLSSEKTELAKANHELQKDNKRLKNIVDAIRLKFSKDVNQLLQYEDSEIRKALVKLYKSTLG